MGRIASLLWEYERLKKHVPAPGNPVVLGLMMLDRYDGIEHANREALHDSFIRGMGDDVQLALKLLERVIAGDGREAVEEALELWRVICQKRGRSTDDVDATCDLARELMPTYIKRAPAWDACPGRNMYRIENYARMPLRAASPDSSLVAVDR